MCRSRFAGLLLLLLASAHGLNNGLGLVPEMGVNTWYMFHSHLSYPNYTWVPPFVLDTAVRNLSVWLQQTGLQAAGYTYVNMDDCAC